MRSQQKPCEMKPFPLARRVGKMRDVASKMLTKTTDRHVASYRAQVTDALRINLERLGVDEAEQTEQLGAFWLAVQLEMIRLTCLAEHRECFRPVQSHSEFN